MQDRLLRITMVAVLLALLAGVAGCTVFSDIVAAFQTEEVYEKSHAPDPDLRLKVLNRNGRVEIGLSDDEQLHIHAVKRAFGAEDLEKVRIHAEKQEDAYLVESVYSEDNLRVSVDLKVAVPRGMEIASADNSNGHLQVENVPGNLQARTSNGNITLTNVAGFVTAHTSNGSVSVRNCSGLDEVRNSNGNIYVDIHEIRGDTQVRTSNGSIEALLHSAVDASVELDTSNGQVAAIHTRLNVLRDETTRLEGVVGDNTHDLLLETSNGNIELQEFGG